MQAHHSLKRRLIHFILIGVTLVVMISGVLIYADARHEVDELFDANLVQTAKGLAGIVSPEALSGETSAFVFALKEPQQVVAPELEPYLVDVKEEGHEYERKTAFQIRDPQGRVLFRSVSLGSEHFASLPPGFSHVRLGDHQWLTFTTFSTATQLWITVGEREDIRQELTNDIALDLLVPFLLFTPLMLLLIWQLIDRAMHPLVQMTRHMDTQDYQTLQTVNTNAQPTEIKSLTDALNDLFTRLNESYAREKNFAADAAHELRNPLAALSIQTDNALAENTNQDLQPILGNIKQVSDRLSHLVRQLLLLSKIDRNLPDEDWQTLNLLTLCQEVIAEHHPKAEAKQQQIHLSTQDISNHDIANHDISTHDKQPTIRGIQELLLSLIANLVDNAIRYTPAQGVIQVTCYAENNTVCFSVADSGPGLSAQAKTRALDRFYREVGSGQSGAGIGLSIVKHVISVHQGSIDLNDAELGGLQVTCRFDTA